LCGGLREEGKITFTVDDKKAVIVVRDVPPKICELYGHECVSRAGAGKTGPVSERAFLMRKAPL